MRLDKFLCEQNIGTRSQVKAQIKKGMVCVNDSIAGRPEQSIDPETDRVSYQGKEIEYRKFVYYMMHKPAGVITALKDAREKTIMDILPDALKKQMGKGIFPVGRLDKDTEGLLLLTNDGELSHGLLSPKKHVTKTYYVEMDAPAEEAAIRLLEQGLDIGEKKNNIVQLTMPAKVDLITNQTFYLTIAEGKFHQIKRMVQAIGREVIYLKRISMGPLILNPELAKGDLRELRSQELEDLLQYKKDKKQE